MYREEYAGEDPGFSRGGFGELSPSYGVQAFENQVFGNMISNVLRENLGGSTEPPGPPLDPLQVWRICILMLGCEGTTNHGQEQLRINRMNRLQACLNLSLRQRQDACGSLTQEVAVSIVEILSSDSSACKTLPTSVVSFYPCELVLWSLEVQNLACFSYSFAACLVSQFSLQHYFHLHLGKKCLFHVNQNTKLHRLKAFPGITPILISLLFFSFVGNDTHDFLSWNTTNYDQFVMLQITI